MKRILLCGFLLSVSAPLMAREGYFLADSIGIERKDGRNYILHKVEAGETYSSLSRRYKVSLEEIQASNPSVGMLSAGYIVRIPYRSATAAAAVGTLAEKPTKEKRIYRVSKGETLYSIATKFQMDLAYLRKLNGLTMNMPIVNGQDLVVEIDYAKFPQLLGQTGQSGILENTSLLTSTTPGPAAVTEQPAAVQPQASVGFVVKPVMHTVKDNEYPLGIARLYGISVDSLKTWNVIGNDNRIDRNQQLIVGYEWTDVNGTPLAETGALPRPDLRNYSPKAIAEAQAKSAKAVKTDPKKLLAYGSLGAGDYKREQGKGILLGETSKKSGPHLGLHRTIKAGSWVKVINPANQKYTVVRIIGVMPQNESPEVIIKISKSAGDEMDILNPTFPIVVESLR